MEKTLNVYRIGSVVILLFSVGLLIFSTWCGLGLTFDSYDYLAAAKSFQSTGILLNKNGQPFIAHAPFLPLLISLIGDNPLPIMRMVYLIFFAVTMTILREIIRQNIRNDFLGLSVYFAITLAVGIQMVHNFLWSEPLFLLFFTFHNRYLIRYLKTYNSRVLGIIIILAFLMGITRNAGFFIILPTTLFLFTVNQVKKTLVIIYFILGSLGFTIWNFYTFFIQKGISTFGEGLSLFSAVDLNILNYLDIISAWVIPAIIPLIVRVILVFGFIVFMIVRFKFRDITQESRLYLFQSIFYILIMVVFINVFKSDVERYLAIIYPFLIIGVFEVIESKTLKFTWVTMRLFIMLISCWIFYVGTRSIKNSIFWNQNKCAVMTKIKTISTVD